MNTGMRLANLLKKAMKDKGFNKYVLAKKIGCAITQITNIVEGKTKTPRDETLFKLADALSLNYDHIFAAAGKLSVDLADVLSNSPVAMCNLIRNCSTLRDKDVDELTKQALKMVKTAETQNHEFSLYENYKTI